MNQENLKNYHTNSNMRKVALTALALVADPSGSDVADLNDLTTGKITAVISDDAEESGEAEDSGEVTPQDLNLINSETSGDITLGGEDHPPDGA